MTNIHLTSKAARKGFCSLSGDSEVFFPEKKPPLFELEEEHDDMSALAELAKFHVKDDNSNQVCKMVREVE